MTAAIDLRRLQLFSKRSVSGDLLGQYRSSFRGTGLVYSDLREYSPGDDVKHIHWKATARTGKVFVKSYQEDRQLRVMLGVDVSSSMFAPKHLPIFSKVLQFCTIIATLSTRGNDQLGIALLRESLLHFSPPSSRRGGRVARLHSLLAQREDAFFGGSRSGHAANLDSVLKDLGAQLRRPSLLFLISDFYTNPFEESLRQLASRHDVVLVHMEHSLPSLPAAGLVTFTDAETGRELLIDTSSNTVRAAWNQALERKRLDVAQIASLTGVEVMHIRDSVLEPLSSLMRRRAHKGAR
jgi:uncharacterized protein (DUF58 family)